MKLRHAPMAALAGMLSCAGSAYAVNVLVNPGFETGNLAPWFGDFGAPTVTNADAHSGSFSAAAEGGDSIRQNFAPVLTSDITQVSAWIKRPPFQFSQYSFYYNDNPTTTFLIQGNSSNWDFFDITGNLTPGKHLTGFSIFGTSPGPAFMDDFTIDANVVPEPASAALAALAAVGVASRRRTRRPDIG
jgi:hypothetical protein